MACHCCKEAGGWQDVEFINTEQNMGLCANNLLIRSDELLPNKSFKMYVRAQNTFTVSVIAAPLPVCIFKTGLKCCKEPILFLIQRT